MHSPRKRRLLKRRTSPTDCPTLSELWSLDGEVDRSAKKPKPVTDPLAVLRGNDDPSIPVFDLPVADGQDKETNAASDSDHESEQGRNFFQHALLKNLRRLTYTKRLNICKFQRMKWTQNNGRFRYHHLYAGSGHVAEAMNDTFSKVVPASMQEIGLDCPPLQCEEGIAAEHVVWKANYVLAHSQPAVMLRKAEHALLPKAFDVISKSMRTLDFSNDDCGVYGPPCCDGSRLSSNQILLRGSFDSGEGVTGGGMKVTVAVIRRTIQANPDKIRQFDIENVYPISDEGTVDDEDDGATKTSTFSQLQADVESIEGCVFLNLVLDPRDHFIRQSRLRRFMSIVYVPGVKFTDKMRADINELVQDSLDQMKALRGQMLDMSTFMPKPGEGISHDDFDFWMGQAHAPKAKMEKDEMMRFSAFKTKREILAEAKLALQTLSSEEDSDDTPLIRPLGKPLVQELSKAEKRAVVQAYIDEFGDVCPQWIRDYEAAYKKKRNRYAQDLENLSHATTTESSYFKWPPEGDWWNPVHHDSLSSRQSVQLSMVEQELALHKEKATLMKGTSETDSDTENNAEIHTELLHGISRTHLHYGCSSCCLPSGTPWSVSGKRRHLPHEVFAFQGVPLEWLPGSLKDWTVTELQDIGGNMWCQVCKMLALLAAQTVDWEWVQKAYGNK